MYFALRSFMEVSSKMGLSILHFTWSLLRFLITLLLILPFSWLFALILRLILPKRFEVQRISLGVPKLPRRFHGVKFIHLTDIHHNGTSKNQLTSDKLLSEVVKFVNSEPNVSLLLLTGDYVQKDPAPIEILCSRWLRHMRLVTDGRAYACLGNHDCKSQDGKEGIVRSLEAIGIPVLQNQFVLPFASSDHSSSPASPSATKPPLSSSSSSSPSITSSSSSSSSQDGSSSSPSSSSPSSQNGSATTSLGTPSSKKNLHFNDHRCRDDNFILVGLGDLWAGDFHPDKVMDEVATLEAVNLKKRLKSSAGDLVKASSECPAIIVLSHNPDTAQVLAKWRLTLQLSGHTHGGQICVPFTRRPLLEYLARLPPSLNFFVPKGFLKCVKRWEWGKGLAVIARTSIPCSSISNTSSSPVASSSVSSTIETNSIVEADLSQVKYNTIYTSSGLATHAGLRMWCPPEVTVITLLRQEV